MKRVAIIDYGSGNLRSVAKAFERMAANQGAEYRINVTSDATDLAMASHIVLPGVGAFGACKQGLEAVPGMVSALREQVVDGGKPFFGICVGMQLMAARGLEHGSHAGLDWIKGDIAAIKPTVASLKIPHMGWNVLQRTGTSHPVLSDLSTGDHAYFVHSFALTNHAPDTVLATADYGGPIVAMVGRDNMVGTQFHPEKSQATGLRLINNFLSWSP